MAGGHWWQTLPVQATGFRRCGPSVVESWVNLEFILPGHQPSCFCELWDFPYHWLGPLHELLQRFQRPGGVGILGYVVPVRGQYPLVMCPQLSTWTLNACRCVLSADSARRGQVDTDTQLYDSRLPAGCTVSHTRYRVTVIDSNGAAVGAGGSTNVLRRADTSSDPFVGCEGSHTANQAAMLWGEQSALYTSWKNAHGGIGLFVRHR